MSDTISGALISAAGSILVAILSRGVETRTRSGQGPLSFVSSSASGARWWYVASAILLVWFALSPALVHHDFAGTNFFVIPLATIVLALLVPTLPLMGASITLGLFAANFLLGPLSNRIGGSQFDTQLVYDPARRKQAIYRLADRFWYRCGCLAHLLSPPQVAREGNAAGRSCNTGSRV